MGMCDSTIGESLQWPEVGLAFQSTPTLAYARFEWVHPVCAAYLPELCDADMVCTWRCGIETVRMYKCTDV